MTFGHDFFGNNNLVMNATNLGPGGEEQPTQTTLVEEPTPVASQSSVESSSEESNIRKSDIMLLVPLAAMFAVITMAEQWNEYRARKYYGPSYSKK